MVLYGSGLERDVTRRKGEAPAKTLMPKLYVGDFNVPALRVITGRAMRPSFANSQRLKEG